MSKWKVYKSKHSFGSGLTWYHEDLSCPFCDYTLGVDDYKFDSEKKVVIPNKCPNCNKEVGVKE